MSDGAQKPVLLSRVAIIAAVGFAIGIAWPGIGRRYGFETREMSLAVTFAAAPLIALLGIMVGKQESRRLVRRAPGAIAESIIRWVPAWSPEVRRAVFDQTIADMRAEHIDAVAAGRKWTARFVVVRGHVALFLSFVAVVCSSTLKRVVEIWKLV